MAVTVNVNVSDIKKNLAAIDQDISKAIVDGLNDAAFGLQKIWLDLISSKIDNPTSFTKRVFVKKSTPENFTALTFIPPIQSEYLWFMIEGEDRKPGDIASLNKSLLIPVNSKLNKYGNFSYGPRRWLGTVDESIKGSFVGKPRGPNSRTAVYQRLKTGRLKLLAIFVDHVKYKTTLPIDKTTEDFASKADQLMQERLRNV